MFGRWRVSAIAALLLAATSCGLPRDPEGTTERIASTHELRVGVSDNPPWTTTTRAQPAGIEPDLVRQFAADMGARVLWTRGNETQLVEALEAHKLDVVIGGFDKTTSWGSAAGLTQPFTQDAEKKKHVMLAAPGENGFILALDRFLTERHREAKGRA